VKRIGRNEPVEVIYICMETIQGISLYSYLYLKLEKCKVSLIKKKKKAKVLETENIAQW
jgi:hypothetical protein